MSVLDNMKPNPVSVIGAAAGAVCGIWSGLDPLVQALLTVQAADIATGLLCGATGRSSKTGSGRIASGVLFTGGVKKVLEWMVVLVCVQVGDALGIERICGMAVTYMLATELVSLLENLSLLGLDVPLLQKLLDTARGTGTETGEKP